MALDKMVDLAAILVDMGLVKTRAKAYRMIFKGKIWANGKHIENPFVKAKHVPHILETIEIKK